MPHCRQWCWCFEQSQSNQIWCVITDIVMPEMNGIALTRELLGLYPKLPVMIMTGHSKEYPTGLALAAGARDFIGKPFSNHEFILRSIKWWGSRDLFRNWGQTESNSLSNSRESSERINELKREIANLTSRLSSDYRGVRLWMSPMLYRVGPICNIHFTGWSLNCDMGLFQWR